MKEFSFSTRIFFGEGSLERLQNVANKRVMIVTDAFMLQSGTVDRVASYLKDCEITVFSDVIPDPPMEVVAAGVQYFQACEPEVMIAVGGGSVIDAAKAIRAVAGRVCDAVDAGVMECFAIPTTSGTGSEVTEYAVVTDVAKGLKFPLASRELRPMTAILDPELVVSAPPSVTADSGMDVLTHALEAYVSTGANDFSDALAEKAISLVMKWLPVAFEDGNDLLAREKMHNASCMAGLAFNSAGLGLCHGIAHGIGGKLHIPHGRTNAIVLPYILRYNADLEHARGNYSVAAKKYQRLAKILDLPCSSVTVGFSQFLKAVEKLNKSLKIPSSLKKGGYDMALYKKEKEAIIEAALADVTTTTNPRQPSYVDIERLLKQIGEGVW